ncbi:MAG: hypothetical protein Gyms2KO_00050 [Gymnodinialimonas sp.]
MLPRKLYLRHREKLEPGFLRSAMELHYYRPTFYRWLEAVSDNHALLYEADLDQSSRVLDVGAYTGEWATEISQRYQSDILAFEPDPRNFRKLEKTASGLQTTTAFPYGLAERDAELEMALMFLGSTVYANGADPGAERALVHIRDIVGVWLELQLGDIDLMKINIEGAEFDLLERMQAAGLLPRVKCFLIQFHEWHPGAYRRRRRLQQALRKTHDLVWDYPFIWEKWQRRL